MAGPSRVTRRRLAKQGKAEKDGSYPTDTRGRAIAAKGRSTDAVRAGRMSTGKKAEIDRRADRELGQTRRSNRKRSPGPGNRRRR